MPLCGAVGAKLGRWLRRLQVPCSGNRSKLQKRIHHGQFYRRSKLHWYLDWLFDHYITLLIRCYIHDHSSQLLHDLSICRRGYVFCFAFNRFSFFVVVIFASWRADFWIAHFYSSMNTMLDQHLYKGKRSAPKPRTWSGTWLIIFYLLFTGHVLMVEWKC